MKKIKCLKSVKIIFTRIAKIGSGKIVLALIFSIIATNFYGQAIPAHPTFLNKALFNTGWNASVTPQTTLAIGSQDLHWTCSTLPTGVGPTAITVNPPPGCFWAAPLLNDDAVWIAPGGPPNGPLLGCSPNPQTLLSCHSSLDYYYTVTFTLTPNSPFQIDWKIFSCGWVEDIKVNNQQAYYRHGGGSNPAPFEANTPLLFSWCKNWVVNNKITVHVKNAPTLSPFCAHTGLKIYSDTPTNNNYPSITGNSLVCAGSTNSYSIPTIAALGITGPGWTYTWTMPGNWGSNNTFQHTLSAVAGINSGVINARIFSIASSYGGFANETCSATAAFSVTVPPPLTITPTSTSICQGNPITLSASGATSYTWNSSATQSPIGFGPNITVSPQSSTTYTVKGVTPLGGCVYSKTLTVIVLPKPIVNITPATSVICQGQTIVLFSQGNAVTYTWLPSGPTGAAPWIQVTPNITTIYTLTGLAANGCTNSSTRLLTVLPTPTISAVAHPPVICPGQSSTLTASGASTYFWPTLGLGTNTAVVSPNTTTSYQVNGTGTNGCLSTKTVQVVVLAAPTVSVSPPFICTGLANTLTAQGASTYTWYIGAAPNQTTFANTPSVVVTVTSSTSYTVCGSVQGSTCTACFSGALNPGGPIQLSTSNLTLCTNAGLCASISVSSTLTAPVNYTWQPGGPMGSTVNVCPSVNTTYTVSATSPSGCPSSTTLAVTVLTNCCPQYTIAGIAALVPSVGIGGPYTNNSYILDGPVTLTANTSFNDIEILMAPAAKIIVPAGIELDLIRAHLYACGIKMWQGIEVQDGGRIKTSPGAWRHHSSLIEGAEVAIDLSNISVANSSPNPPIEIVRTIFNRNYIGIRIRNSSPALDSLALGISGCVFSSRNYTFTSFPNPLLWPESEKSCSIPTVTALRCPTSQTTGLAPPYLNFPAFTQTTLLQPYNFQPAHIGIQIQKIGNPAGVAIKTGIQIGYTYPGPIADDFNLFEGLGVGIEVTDASLTTLNNVFQNMYVYFAAPTFTGTYGGQGIKHVIRPNTLMNARLKLIATNSDNGNRFWNCITGVQAFNVHDCWIHHAKFRSNHSALVPNSFFGLAGDTGVSVITNRFDFGVQYSQFNNIKHGVVFSTPTNLYNYDMTGAGPTPGISMRGIIFNYNYFGPEVSSATAYSGGGGANTSEYMSNAIQIKTPLTAGWNYHPALTNGASCWFVANKIDRAFRGISIDGLEDAYTLISGNSIHIEDDFTFGMGPGLPAPGFGIALTNNMNNAAITNNTLTAQPWHFLAPNNPTVSLVHCSNNFGTGSPRVECNSTKNSYIGFHFEGANAGTIWEGNEMCVHWAGMVLTNSAVIGPQGDIGNNLGSGNAWYDCESPNNIWTSVTSPYHTYCENSDPSLSLLYVRNIPPNEPVINISAFPAVPYSLGPSIDNTAPIDRLYDCVPSSWQPPNWRSIPQGNLSLGLEKSGQANTISIYPNPTNGLLSIASSNGVEIVVLKIVDLTGKLILKKELKEKSEYSIDLQILLPGIYLIEVSDAQNQVYRKKLIKTD